jgi:hypothetical protein
MIEAVRVKGFLLRIGDHAQRTETGAWDSHNRRTVSAIEAPRSGYMPGTHGGFGGSLMAGPESELSDDQ